MMGKKFLLVLFKLNLVEIFSVLFIGVVVVIDIVFCCIFGVFSCGLIVFGGGFFGCGGFFGFWFLVWMVLFCCMWMKFIMYCFLLLFNFLLVVVISDIIRKYNVNVMIIVGMVEKMIFVYIVSEF